MFPNGADAYIDDIDHLISLGDGSIRTAIDTGCGVASWGAFLLSRNILAMSFAPRDSHEAQVQFALKLWRKRVGYYRSLIPQLRQQGRYQNLLDMNAKLGAAAIDRNVPRLKYFGLNHVSEIPNLIGTVEVPEVPFSSISILKKYGKEDMVYKIFSRKIMQDRLLDEIFSMRIETVRIDWPAYPHFKAPEVFSPIILDGKHLYYINSFENAASTIETSAVASENVARLIISRLSDEHQNMENKKFHAADGDLFHLDL